MWVPGHSEIDGKELADTLAKAATREAQSLGEETSIITIPYMKKHARNSV